MSLLDTKTMSTHDGRIRYAVGLIAALILCMGAHAQEAPGDSQQVAVSERPAPMCSGEDSPYRDFDFLIGAWDFFGLDGEKIGEHLYSKKEQGCLILEEWTTVFGTTGTGMNFVDPETGLWRQVWMSPLFHIDYSGGRDENGGMLLEGRVHYNSSGKSARVRGVWTMQGDGSIKQDFLQYNDETHAWEVLFAGFSRPKQN